MQPDVLSAFLGNKSQSIKVFSTDKRVKPFSMPSRIIRKAFPFLVVSAMTFTACSENKSADTKENTAEQVEKIKFEQNLQKAQDSIQVPWIDTYKEVVEKYRLVGKKDKEPLSIADIDALMKTPQIIEVTDTNFNHAPENVDNFWKIIKSGIGVAQNIQKDSAVSEQIKQQYRDACITALSKITKLKKTENTIDLADYNNLHAFAFFEKMLKYKDDAELIFYQNKGWIDEQTEFFGRYYQDHLDFEKKAQNYSGVEAFAKALYANSERFIVEAKDSVYANALSRKMYEEWRCAQGIEKEHLGAFIDTDSDNYANNTVYGNKRGYLLGINLDINAKGEVETPDGLSYLPVGLIEIHENQHIGALPPKSYEKAEHNKLISEKAEINDMQGLNSNYVELGPTLYTLTMSDRIYKAIHKIDRDKEVDYGVNIQVADNSIALGEIANWFGKMLEKYPSESIDKVMQEKEVLEQINVWGVNKHELPLMQMNNVKVSR